MGRRRALPTVSQGRDRPDTKVSPSILSSDFANLASDCGRVVDEGAEWLHCDVMDGHYVPNISFGAPVLKCLRKHTDAFMDCHLMVAKPGQWVERIAHSPGSFLLMQELAAAGIDLFTFHLEVVAPKLDNERHQEVVQLARKVRDAGMYAGIALCPSTPVEHVLPYAEAGDIDLVLPLSVEPGFSGQKFQPHVMEKVRALRERFPSLQVQVDGGISPSTIGQAAKAGANIIVAGSAIFGSDDRRGVIKILKDAVNEAAASARL